MNAHTFNASRAAHERATRQNRALTAAVQALREWDLTPEQVANLAADLPGEYAATVKGGAE